MELVLVLSIEKSGLSFYIITTRSLKGVIQVFVNLLRY